MKIVWIILFSSAFGKCSALVARGSVINEIFDRATDVVSDRKCVRHLQQSRLLAENFTLWAVQMLDATDKFPTGVLFGSYHHLGNFDECLGVRSRTATTTTATIEADSRDLITGKYCLATVELRPSYRPPQQSCKDNTCSAWEKLQPASHRFQISRHRLQWAVCVPASCSAKDLQKILKAWATDLQDLRINVTVDEAMCQTSDSSMQSTGVWPFFGALMGLYFSLLFAYGWMKSNSKYFAAGAWHSAFDVRQHWQQLADVTTTKDSSIDCINGLKVFGIVLVVFSHRYEALAVGPLLNGQAIEEIYDSVFDTLSMNGSLIVDIFFTISGFLLCWNLLNLRETFNFVVVVIHRYIRLTPALVVVIFFQAFLLYDLATGPLWPAKVGHERDNCLSNWWTNVLYINNYVHAKNSCIDPSWYLAVEFQLFLVGLLIILCMKKWKRGYISLVPALVASVVVPFVVTYVRNLDPTFIADADSLGRSLDDETYMRTYVPTHCRAGPYVVGMTFAFWLYKMNISQTKMSKWVLWSGWVLSPLLMTSLWSAALLFYRPHAQVNRALAALYAALHRTLFAVGIGFIITACALGQGGVVNRFLSWRYFRPLSRLVYSVFLCHTLIQMFQFAPTRTQTYMSNTNLVWYTLSDIVISTGIATVLFLTIEKPALDFTSKMLRKFQEKDVQLPVK